MVSTQFSDINLFILHLKAIKIRGEAEEFYIKTKSTESHM